MPRIDFTQGGSEMATTTVEPNGDVNLGQLHHALERLRDGDFSARLPEDWRHGGGMVARVFNSMAAKLEELAVEFIRITEEVGTLGMYGGWAEVDGLAGRWGEMRDSLNRMSEGLTIEVRRTSLAAQSWAEGDARERMTPDRIGGEFAEMQRRLNAVEERWAGARKK
jgi:methyl-accepting chemotaxis protein